MLNKKLSEEMHFENQKLAFQEKSITPIKIEGGDVI